MQRIKTDVIQRPVSLAPTIASVPFPFSFSSFFFSKSPTLEPCLTNKPQAYQTALDKNCSDSYWDVIVPRIPSRRNGKLEQSSTDPTASFTRDRGENCYVSETTSLPFCSSLYKIPFRLNKLPGLQVALDMHQVNKAFNLYSSYLNDFFPALAREMGQ